MQYKFLSQQFYCDYKDCSEIPQKVHRPYAVVVLVYNGYDVAIPFRSSIRHKYAFFTTPSKDKGLDYTKAIFIIKPEHLDNTRNPYINPDEIKSLYNKEIIIKNELEQYINQYKNAYKKQHIYANKVFCSYSCLQYFHKEINLA